MSDDGDFEIEFEPEDGDIAVLWFVGFFDWDGGHYIVGVFDDEDPAFDACEANNLGQGYFYICPLILNAPIGSDDDLLFDMPDRVICVPSEQTADGETIKKIDRKHLTVIK